MRKPAYIDTQNFGLDELFFADEIRMTKPFPIHRHSFCEVHFIVNGLGSEIINGVEYPLSRGALSLKMPWHVHELRPDSNAPLEFLKCSFRMSLLENGGLMENIGDVLAQGYDRCPMAQVPLEDIDAVSSLFHRLIKEQQANLPLCEEQMATLTTQILIRFLRSSAAAGVASNNTAHDLLRLMNLRYRDPELTCAKLAESVHYSESQVARILKEAFGLTFGELLREIRIRNACELLKTTDYPAESIAVYVGYGSRDGFYAAFLDDRGLPPAEYRKRYGNSAADGARVLSSSKIYAKMVYYLHSHYTEDITLANAAERFQYSQSHLRRILSEQGTSFTQLLEEIRIYHARQLLLESTLSHEAVARETGFTSPETFYRAFKRQTGKTPSEFRRGGIG